MFKTAENSSFFEKISLVKEAMEKLFLVFFSWLLLNSKSLMCFNAQKLDFLKKTQCIGLQIDGKNIHYYEKARLSKSFAEKIIERLDHGKRTEFLKSLSLFLMIVQNSNELKC